MTLLKKLVCKSVKEDLYCDGEYDRRFDTASACVQFEPRKKSRQKDFSNSKKNNRPSSSSQKPKSSKRRSRSKGRQMHIPHVIPEQAGITHTLHHEFDDLSENDFVVNAVRKTLNDRPNTKRKGRPRRLCQSNDVDSLSTASSLTVDIHGTRTEKFYYGHAGESDVISQEGRSFSLAKTLGLVQASSNITNIIPTTPSPPPSNLSSPKKPASKSVVPNYQSENVEEDDETEADEGYLEQCMVMVADLLVGEESGVPKDIETLRITKNGRDDEESEVFKTASSQNTYTDESSRDSFSSGQSSYEDSGASSGDFESNIFCNPR